MKKIIILISITLSLFLLNFNFLFAQHYSSSAFVDSAGYGKEILSLDRVFNITKVSQEAQTIMPDLYTAERSMLDPYAMPPVIGVVRDIPQPIIIRTEDAKMPEGYIQKNDTYLSSDSLLLLTASIRSENAAALRVLFSVDEGAPPDLLIYLYSKTGEIYGPVTPEMFYEGKFWSHMVFSDEVFVQVQLPWPREGTVENYIKINKIAHTDSTAFSRVSCLQDVNCDAANNFSGIEFLRQSVAGIASFHQEDPTQIWCSGALLNNTNSHYTGQPLFQTVGHCINTDSQANNASFFFDYRTVTCDSGTANYTQVKGSNRLWSIYDTTPTISDYALLLLNEKPSTQYYPKWYLGWTTANVSHDDLLWSVSHPAGNKQKYTRARKRHYWYWVMPPCLSLPFSKFHYLEFTSGTTLGGSSGGPWVNGNYEVVGALYGSCGDNSDPCSYDDFYGAVSKFGHFFSNMSDWLDGDLDTELTYSPSSIEFESARPHYYSYENIEFENSSSGFNLELSLSLSGPDADLFTILIPGGGNTLYIPPGGSRTAIIRFLPNEGGETIANLNIHHNATNHVSPFSVYITGNAVPDRPGPVSGPQEICSVHQNLYWIDFVMGATSYEWTYTGSGELTEAYGSNSVFLNPFVTSGDLRVRAVNPFGASFWRTMPISAYNPLSPLPPIEGPATVCESECQTYSVHPLNWAVSYNWNYTGNGTIQGSGTTITLCPDSGGTLSVYAENPCGQSNVRYLNITTENAPPPQPGPITGDDAVCAGVATGYIISPVSGASSYTWTFSGTGVISGSETDILLTALSSGWLRVKANNSCGSSSFRNKYISVYGQPSQPGPITGADEICMGEPNTYSIEPISDATSYEWVYYGNGSISGSGKSITLTAYGNGKLRVRAVNACGVSNWKTMTIIVVSPLAQPGPITGAEEICMSEPSTYSIEPISEATSYEWDYSGDGTISGSGKNIMLTAYGSGNLGVRAINACGVSEWKQLFVNTVSSPGQPGPISGHIFTCAGDSNFFHVEPVPEASSYEWDFSGEGTIHGDGTSIVLNALSSGNIQVRTHNECGTSEWQSLFLTVTPLPPPTGPISGTSSVCTGQWNTYSISMETGNYWIAWEFLGDGILGGHSTNVHLSATSGGELRVRTGNTCGTSDWEVLMITVSESPPSLIGPITGPSPVCSGDCNTYSVDPVEGATSYQWMHTGGAQPSGSGNIIELCPINNGHLRVRAVNGCGVSNLSSIPIPVQHPLPQPGPINGPALVSAGDCNLYSISWVQGATLYAWEFTGAGSIEGSGTQITLCPQSSGLLSVTAANLCGESQPNSLDIEVVPPTMVEELVLFDETIADSETECFDALQTITVSDFIVEAGGNATLIAGQNIIMLPGTTVEHGGYLLARIAAHEDDYCGIPRAIEFDIEPVASKEDVVSADFLYEICENGFFKLYPNPTNGTFTLELTTSELDQTITMEVYSMLSARLFSKELPSQRLHTLSLEGQQPGMYIIRVMKGDKVGVERLIKR